MDVTLQQAGEAKFASDLQNGKIKEVARIASRKAYINKQLADLEACLVKVEAATTFQELEYYGEEKMCVGSTRY